MDVLYKMTYVWQMNQTPYNENLMDIKVKPLFFHESLFAS